MNFFKIVSAFMLSVIASAALLCGQASAASVITPKAESHYVIKSGDKVIGYSVYQAGNRMTLAGESFIKYRSLSVVRAGIGNITESVFQSDFSVNLKTLLPSYFIMQQNIEGFEAVSETVYSEGVIAQKNAAANAEPATYLNESAGSCYLFVSNLWGRLDSFIEHYDILIHAMLGEKEKSFDVYDPILRTVGTISIEKEKEGSYSYKGASREGVIYIFKDFYGTPLLRIFFDSKEKKIYRIDEIAGTVTIELSNSKAAELLKKSLGADLGINRTALSPIYFQKPASLKMTGLAGKFSGRGLKAGGHEAIGFEQTFNGESSDTSAEGQFTVKKTEIKIDKPNRFPPFKLDASFAPYLKPEAGIESKDDYLVNKAQEITWKSRDCRTAAGRIAKWIHENIRDGISLPSAIIAFSAGIGNMESKSLLMTAMCRAAGMPARTAGGIVFEKGDYIPGYWAEVYMEGSGWLPFDMKTGEEGVDAARVWLFEHGEITSLSVESLDYLPKVQKKVPFQRKDISWPVEESRTYEIRINGMLIGKERAKVTDMVFADDAESYLFSSEALMRVAGTDYRSSMNASFDVNALPLSCELSGNLGGKEEKQKFVFSGNFIERIISEDAEGNAVKNNIPYSKGTYLLDNRFLSLWALAAGQIPNVELGGKYRFTAFVPGEMKTLEFELSAKGFERVEAEGRDFNAFKCESSSGMVFYIDQTGRVVKIVIPAQKLEFTLIGTAMGEDEEKPLSVDPEKTDEELTEDPGSEAGASENGGSEKTETPSVPSSESEEKAE